MKAVLVLEDGSTFYGKGFGSFQETVGEVVFNTSMSGYQEVIADPSYTGQIVVMTYPLIGNYGVNHEDLESARPRVKGFIVTELCDYPSNWRCQMTLDQYFQEYGIPGISDVDTRALTRIIRTEGTLRGVIASADRPVEELIAKAQAARITGPELVRSVTTDRPYHLPGHRAKVVLVDFGVKTNIIRSLQHYGCDVTVVPSWTPAADILKLQPDGILLSNGPGDPRDVPEAITTVRELVGIKPIFGICLGHQVLGLAMGGSVKKLKFGHRGANQPVKDLQTNRVYITAQNHSYALEPDSLPQELAVTHINLNDQTVEGMAHKSLPIFSVQYHPEAAPGPEDSRYLFDKFISLMGQKPAV